MEKEKVIKCLDVLSEGTHYGRSEKMMSNSKTVKSLSNPCQRAGLRKDVLGNPSFERSEMYLRKINWLTACRMDWRRSRLKVNRPIRKPLRSS